MHVGRSSASVTGDVRRRLGESHATWYRGSSAWRRARSCRHRVRLRRQRGTYLGVKIFDVATVKQMV
jgi:hypothetical protein